MTAKSNDFHKIRFKPDKYVNSPNDSNNRSTSSKYDTANLLSKYTYYFLWPLIRKANNRKETLYFQDFDHHAPSNCRLDNTCSDRLAAEWSNELANCAKSQSKPSMSRAVFRAYKWRILVTSLILILSECICEPLYFHFCIELIDTISRYPRSTDGALSAINGSTVWINSTSSNDDSLFEFNSDLLTGKMSSTNELIFNSIMFLLFISLTPLLAHPYNWRTSLTALQMRNSLARLIYSKALNVDKSSKVNNYKQAISLISKDIDLIDTNLNPLVWVFSGPLECIVLTILLTRSVGYETTCVSLLMSLSLALIRGLLNVSIRTQIHAASRLSDERVNMVNEAVGAIRILRMFSWTESVAKRIELARAREISKRKYSTIMTAIDSTLFFVGSPAGSMMTLAFGHYYMKLHISQAIVSEVFLVTVIHQRTLSKYVSIGIQSWINLAIVFDRIGRYLRTEEVGDNDRGDSPLKTGLAEADCGSELKPGCIVIEADGISASWSEDEQICFNNVGFSLKSGELLMVTGKVGAGKSSLLQALLGELRISSGSLKLDPKARVSYCSQEAWIFSGTVRENILFGAELELDRYKQVLSACSLMEDLYAFPRRDLTSIGNRGVTLSGGQKARINLARSLYQSADLYLLDDPLSAVDSHVAQGIVQRALMGFLADKAVILVTHQAQFMRNSSKILILRDNDCVVGTFDSLLESGNLIIGEHEDDNQPNSDYSSRDKAKEETVLRDISKSIALEADGTVLVELEDMASRYQALKAMKFYLNNTGSLIEHCLFIAGNACIRLFFICVPAWLNLWAGVHQFNHYGFGDTFIEGLHFDQALMIGACLWGAIVLATIIRSLQFYLMTVRGARRIFGRLMRSILWAKMSFLDLTPAGQLINRTSAYVSYLDTAHVALINEISVIGVSVVFMFFTIFCTEHKLAISILLTAFVVYQIFKQFIKLIIAIKQVAGIRASAVYTHVGITLDGLSTIRASKRQDMFLYSFSKLQDAHSSIWFLNMAIRYLIVNALNFTLILFFTSLVTLDIVSTMNGNGQFAFLGLNLALLMSRSCQMVFTKFVELYTRLQAINGISDYCNVQSESSALDCYKQDTELDDCKTMKAIFSKGQVEFIGVSLKYNRTDKIVLRDLSFKINSRERIGVVGRTGAGKSSLISVLFRLYHFEGFILIDGQDTKQLELDSLRRSISIIPQDPVLFSGTLRHNLDPLDEYTDCALWKALEAVQLSDLAKRQQDGLGMDISEAGSNLSAGQRQLVCLARAILRRNKLLVLDEASANVDTETDKLIQRAIRTEFVDCTVITVAHRLSTVMDYDKIMVIDGGRLCEFDQPMELIKQGGLFASMVASSGSQKSLLKGIMSSAEVSALSEDQSMTKTTAFY